LYKLRRALYNYSIFKNKQSLHGQTGRITAIARVLPDLFLSF
jgi:hypothetical protein